MNRTEIIIAAIIGIAVFVGGFVIIRNFIRNIVSKNVTTGLSSPTQTEIQTINKNDWKEYTSSVFDYTIKYPPNGNIDNPTSDGSDVLKVPANNVDEGVKLTFKSGTFQGSDFASFTNSVLAELKNNPVVKFSSDIRSVDLAGLSGYQFDITTDQTITYTFLQTGSNEYFEIINETKDPNNKGYINLSNEILNALQVTVTLPTI